MCNGGMPPHTVWRIMNCILMFSTSLVVQWSRICLAMQQTGVWSLVPNFFDSRDRFHGRPSSTDRRRGWFWCPPPCFHHSPPVMWPSSYEATDQSMALGLGTPAIKVISYHLWLQGIPNLVESSNTWNENFSTEKELSRGKQLTHQACILVYFFWCFCYAIIY